MSTNHMSKGWWVGIIFLSALLLLNVTAVAYQYLDRPWSPLCDHEVQKILNPKGSDGIARVKASEDVKVRAVKCNTTDEPVKVREFTSWYSKKPLGTSIQSTSGSSEREPGEQVLFFDNEIPVSVVTRARTLKMSTGKDVVWVLTGTETPYRDGGKDGISETWVTEPFIIET